MRSVGAELEAFCRGIWNKGWREAIRKCVPTGTPIWSKTRDVRHKLVDASSFSACVYLC